MNEHPEARLTERLSGLTFVLCFYAMSVWVMAAVPVNASVSRISAPVLPAALFVCAVYLADGALIERGYRVDLMVACNVICAAVGAVLYRSACVFEPSMPVTRTAFAVLYAFCIIAAWYVSWDPVKSSTVIACFDWMAVLLVLYIVFRRLDVVLLTAETPGICAAAMAMSLIAMIRIRLDSAGTSDTIVGNEAAGRLLLSIFVILIVILAVLLAAGLSGALHGLSEVLLLVLSAAGGGLLIIAGGLFSLLERFVEWLTQFFPADYESDAIDTAAVTSYESDSSAASGAHVPLWLFLLLAIGVCVLVVVFFRRIRGIRIEGHIVSDSPAVTRRRGGILQLLRQWLCVLRERIRFAVLLRRRAATPAGMLIWCERHFRKRCPRETAESGSAYLRRLAETLEESETDTDVSDGLCALRELADLTEQAFYAPSAEACNCKKDPVLFRRIRRTPL